MTMLSSLTKKTQEAFEQLIQGGRVIEQDRLGIKVMQLNDGRMVKFFRRKKRFSSQLWSPHAARFAKNAEILKQRGIESVTVVDYFHVPEIGRNIVVYQRAPGETCRSALRNADTQDQADIIRHLAGFLARLHQKGILFRSVHLGNIVIEKNNQTWSFRLIDLVDMRFNKCGPLSLRQRLRNFAHMLRRPEDRQLLPITQWDLFLESYFKAAALSPNAQTKLRCRLTALVAALD